MTMQTVPVQRWQDDLCQPAMDHLAEEVPVALVFNGMSHAVMMALPNDLKYLAKGFSLSEGIIDSLDQLYGIELIKVDSGYEIQLTISAEKMAALKHRRRQLAGRTGCGLCGIESLQQAIRPVARVSTVARPTHLAIQRALSQFRQYQPMQAQTGGCHGAAWCDAEGTIQYLYEDVGRHNALDKLIGCFCQNGDQCQKGFVLISSRASYEMVHKLAAINVGSLVAVSAPTSLAVGMAREANMNLIGFARPGRHQVYHESGVVCGNGFDRVG